MDLHHFDLNLLVTLDALLTEKNVTRAGLRMNLSLDLAPQLRSAVAAASGKARYTVHQCLRL